MKRSFCTIPTLILLGIMVSALPRTASAAGWTTSGTEIRTPANAKYIMAGYSWFGFETTTGVPKGLWTRTEYQLVDSIKQYKANFIRIPFSSQMWESDPICQSHYVTACPDLKGKTERDALANIINYAGSVGLHVVLDHHRSEAGNSAESNGLWYTSAYPESSWINDWVNIQRWVHGVSMGGGDTVTCNYLASDGYPIVIGYDIHNEPHTVWARSGPNTGATWGSGDGIDPTVNPNPNPYAITNTTSPTDWRLAAERCGDQILGDAASRGYDKPIIFVEGITAYPQAGGNWAAGPYDAGWDGGNIMGINGNAGHPGAPIVLNAGGNSASLGAAVNNQVAYSSHDYGPSLFAQPWFNTSTCYKSGCSASSLADVWNKFWAFCCTPTGINPVWPGHSAYPWANTGATAYTTAPLWLGEFGTDSTSAGVTYSGNGSQGQWFTDMVNFIQSSYAKTTANDSGIAVSNISWSYWAINNGAMGVLGSDWVSAAYGPRQTSYLCNIEQVADPNCGSTGPLPLPQ